MTDTSTHTPRRAVGPVLAAFALVLSAAACNLETVGIDGPVNACAADGACPGGRCAMGMCIADEAAPLRLALAVSQAGATFEGATLGHATAPFDYQEGLSGLVELPRPLTLVGQVRAPAALLPEAARGRVDAEVFLTRGGLDVAEVPSTVRAGTFAEAQAAGGFADVDFLAVALEGVPYAIRVAPRGSAAALLPPLRLPARPFVDDDGDGVVRVDLVYPDGPAIRYGGTVVDADASPLPGLTVVAVTSDGRTVSSLGTTDENGDFALAIDPSSPDFVVRISGLEPIPSIVFDPRYGAVDFAPVITVPEVPVVRYAATVVCEETRCGGETGGGEVPRAVVVFRSDALDLGDTGLSASFENQTESAADGTFALDLVPGRYTVTVWGPPDLPLGVTTQSVEILRTSAPLAGQLLQLPPRRRYEGAARVADLGDALVGAKVQARALRSLGSRGDLGATARVNRSSDAVTTDVAGGFGLFLDEGAYDLLVEPAAGSRFPVTRRTVVVPAAAIERTEGSRVDLDVEVPFPSLLPGTVLDHRGEPVVGAEVSVHAFIDDVWGSRTLPLGRSFTDENGAYLLFLPSR